MRALCFALLLCLGAPALALQPDVPHAVVASQATRIVVGEVTTLEPRFVAGGDGYIETGVFISTDRSLRGSGADLELVIEGGRIGELATGSSDAPKVELDGRYIFLLVEDFEGRWRVLGGQRGAIALRSPTHPRAKTLTQVAATLEVPVVD